jgi:uncharacterized protein YraI
MKKMLLGAVAVATIASPALAENACTVNDPTGTPLNVRERPNGPILGALKNGVPVSIRERRGDWVRVVPREGKTGWVVQKYLDCTEQSTTRDAEIPIAPTNTEIDGNVILYACTASDPKNSSFCHIYMTAVADSLAFMRGVLKDNFPICVTGNITSRQLGDVVVKYIRDNPRDRHLNAATIAALAFKDAWPCN